MSELKQRWIDLVRVSVRSLMTWAALPEPGPATVRPLTEDGDMLVYSVGFVPTAADVVKAEFVSEVGGVESAVVECPLGSTVEFKWEQDATVTLKQVQVDDVGNRSPVHVQTFTATDTIAPPEAGDAVVTNVGEE